MADCQSGCGPCDYWLEHKAECPICAASTQRYYDQQEKLIVDLAISTLTSRGYKVTKEN